MRIVHFLRGRANPNSTNGGDRVICHLASTAAEMGGEVFVLALSDKESLPLGKLTIRHVAPPRDPFTIPVALTRALLQFKPDIVHLHGVYGLSNVALARWLRRQGIAYAVSPHGGLMPGVLRRDRMKKLSYLRFLGRPFLRRAALVHAVSEAEAAAVRRFAPAVPAVVAPHGLEGVDPASLDSGYLRRRYPELAGRRILGFLGRLDPFNKGLDLIAEACAQSRSRLANVAIILAGPDWKGRTASLRERVRDLDLGAMIIFNGPIPTGPAASKEKFDFLASCDAFVHPSRWEAGIPFSVLDALEAGRPCMVTDEPFFADFFQRRQVGMRVPATTDGVARGLRYLAGVSAEELRAVGAKGRLAALREFSWERTTAKLLRAYERVLGGKEISAEGSRG